MPGGQGGDAGHRHAGRAGSPARTLRASHLVEVVTVPGFVTGSRRVVEVLTLATGSRRAPARRVGRFTSSNAQGFAPGRGGDGAGPWHWITPGGRGGDGAGPWHWIMDKARHVARLYNPLGAA